MVLTYCLDEEGNFISKHFTLISHSSETVVVSAGVGGQDRLEPSGKCQLDWHKVSNLFSHTSYWLNEGSSFFYCVVPFFFPTYPFHPIPIQVIHSVVSSFTQCWRPQELTIETLSMTKQLLVLCRPTSAPAPSQGADKHSLHQGLPWNR